MVKITCDDTQKQAVLEWLREKDTEMFGDVRREDYALTGVDRYGYFKAADGHAGIFDLIITDTGIEADCDGYIVFSKGHFLDKEIIEYYAALKKEFPFVGLHGAFGVGLSDDWWVRYSVEAEPESDRVLFEDLGDVDDDDENYEEEVDD